MNVMTQFLVKKFVKNYEKIDDLNVRTAYGVLTGICGIVCNILLFVAKLLIGLIANSVSVMADAFNNLSDAASSVVGLVGAKLAAKPADEEHPFGHGRYEYIAAFIVAFLILEVAFSCFKSSFGKIINPEEVEFSIISIVVLCLSVLVKLWLSYINKKLGKKIDSKVMLATSKDAIGDVFVTSATIIALLVLKIFGLNIDGFIGCGVSIMVFIAGINVAKDTIEPLLGEAVDKALCDAICSKVESYDEIEGTHDLIVHSYGPARKMATIHAEVRNDINIEVAHEIIDKIEHDVLHDMGIFLVIHMDPVEVADENVLEKKRLIEKIVKEADEKASIHDFRMVNGVNQINLVFDLVLPFTYNKEQGKAFADIVNQKAKEIDKRYSCVITVEYSYVGSSEE